MRIKTWRGAVVFCLGVTAVAMVMGHAISWYMLPTELFWQIFNLHNAIVLVVAPPIALWGGFQIRDRTFAMDRLQYMVDHDSLTRLFTRNRVIELATKSGQVLIIDIDHFKRINDCFGHLTGDRAIVEAAQIVRENVRQTDLVGRFGGEEFIVFLTGADPAKGCQIAEKLRAAIATARLCEGQIGKLTFSLGLASHLPGHDIVVAIRQADDALYAAKAAGRNRVCAHDGAGTTFCGEKAFAIRAVAP